MIRQSPTDAELFAMVRNILWRDWDPIGINTLVGTEDEYDVWMMSFRASSTLPGVTPRIAPSGNVKKTQKSSLETRYERLAPTLRNVIATDRRYHFRMMKTKKPACLTFVLLLAISGCGQIPLISPNREGFAPWEKLPEGNGIRYLEKFTRDPGIDPLYLAKISYDDDKALQLVVDTFGLVPQEEASDEEYGDSTFTTTLGDAQPAWFPLAGITDRYVYPSKEGDEYVSNLWVNENKKIMILERSWW